MTSGPKNTTQRVPWTFFWADCTPGVPPRPTTGSCHVSSPCHHPVIRSLSSQRGHRADGPAREPAPRTRASPAGLVPGIPLHPGWHGVMDLSRAGHLCRRLPVRVPLDETCPSHPWEHRGFAAAGSGTGGPGLGGRRALAALSRWQNFPK